LQDRLRVLLIATGRIVIAKLRSPGSASGHELSSAWAEGLPHSFFLAASFASYLNIGSFSADSNFVEIQ
jgi:hypothetical protein